MVMNCIKTIERYFEKKTVYSTDKIIPMLKNRLPSTDLHVLDGRIGVNPNHYPGIRSMLLSSVTQLDFYDCSQKTYLYFVNIVCYFETRTNTLL